ncbi:alpha/beta hydrolase [Aggregicoccus sp. 17bor-14]|uniref:alpha/beta fold hydrolase n=1 Tax=Myxococcaceae TaxID=31 RepID=UPI00129CE025|nr:MULTISPECIES: alpha/beta hydrolase [Myxococcaceae]MBF5042898.1 alpha/beta hydrolase [Simulacricoccus sp. 17bor-14]MRI88665.1 alpha/beta hydrolase [Aggregicoccus sp. 17bor-14]
MLSVTSRDGTRIAFSRVGEGPALILVDGAMCYRAHGPMTALAASLAPHFTVYTYDRRGRGESGDTAPYAPAREVEDLAALLGVAGGSASLFGLSSGAALALDAAQALGARVQRLALYEAPFIVDDSRPPVSAEALAQLNLYLTGGHRSAAVKLFLRLVGMPALLVPLMPLLPGWSKGTAIAHTLRYDLAELLRGTQDGTPLPRERWRSVSVPTLALVGGKSPAWMHRAMEAVAALLPQVQLRALPGQSHLLKAEALAPVLVEFLSASPLPLGEGQGEGLSSPA